MSTSVTAVSAGVDAYIADVIATANGDTDVTITHNLGEVPLEVHLVPIANEAYTSKWAWSASPTANTVTVTKVGTGGGVASKQIRVIVKRPHSIGR